MESTARRHLIIIAHSCSGSNFTMDGDWFATATATRCGALGARATQAVHVVAPSRELAGIHTRRVEAAWILAVSSLQNVAWRVVRRGPLAIETRY